MLQQFYQKISIVLPFRVLHNDAKSASRDTANSHKFFFEEFNKFSLVTKQIQMMPLLQVAYNFSGPKMALSTVTTSLTFSVFLPSF